MSHFYFCQKNGILDVFCLFSYILFLKSKSKSNELPRSLGRLWCEQLVPVLCRPLPFTLYFICSIKCKHSFRRSDWMKHIMQYYRSLQLYICSSLSIMLHRYVCSYRARVVLRSRTHKIWHLGKSFLHAFPAHNAGWLVLHVQRCRRQEPRFLLSPTQTSSVVRHVTSQKDVCVRAQGFYSVCIYSEIRCIALRFLQT